METFDELTIALPKGRLEPKAWAFLEDVGLAVRDRNWPDRSLIEEDRQIGARYLLVRPSDVVTYVAEGAADLGIVGKDVIMEADMGVYEVLDLQFGGCRLAVAAPKNSVTARMAPLDFYRSRGRTLRVATKYPNIAARYFADLEIPAQMIPLRGSVELAPTVGMADVIMDLVSTGKTLETNALVILEEVAQITARLIVNPVSMKVKPRIATILSRLRDNDRKGNGGLK
ncbi:MAG: ATP phosphoribosyltransferase [Clostridia bacterium]